MVILCKSFSIVRNNSNIYFQLHHQKIPLGKHNIKRSLILVASQPTQNSSPWKAGLLLKLTISFIFSQLKQLLQKCVLSALILIIEGASFSKDPTFGSKHFIICSQMEKKSISQQRRDHHQQKSPADMKPTSTEQKRGH